LGEIKPTKQFFEELNKEQLTLPDVWHVLRTGYIFDPPESDIVNGEWKYRIEGRSTDGVWIMVVFYFKGG
jgi:hypothetical protein